MLFGGNRKDNETMDREDGPKRFALSPNTMLLPPLPENKEWNEMMVRYCVAKRHGDLSAIQEKDPELATWVAQQHGT